MDNQQLKEVYNQIYASGADTHYTKSRFNLRKEIHEAILDEIDWSGKTVIDVGSGTGEFSLLLANAGATVTGIDYSEEATKESQKHEHPNLSFETKDLSEAEGSYDVVVSLGTLEHMDDPLEGLQKMKSLLSDNGSIIVTVPNWLNPRGYVLITLLFLYGAKITLADLHHLSPSNFENWAKELDMDLSWKTVNHTWGSGDVGVADLRDRLPKVSDSSDLGLTEERINALCDWLEENALPMHKEPTKISGALGLFHFRKT